MAKIEITGVIGQDYFYSDFLTDYANAKQQGLIELQINSLGGSVVDGFAIADFIKQHSTDFLSVTNSGNIASIATTIFFALPFEKRTYDINKGFFVIHNPFVPNEAIENTTAQGLADASEKLQEIEDKILADIVKATGADKEAVKALMIVDKPLTIEQIKVCMVWTSCVVCPKRRIAFSRFYWFLDETMRTEPVTKLTPTLSPSSQISLVLA